MPAVDINIKNMINAAVWLDDTSGVSHDISGSSASIAFDWAHRGGIYQTFADDWDRTTPGPRGGTATLSVWYTPTDDQGFTLLRDWFMEDFADRLPRTMRFDGTTEVGDLQITAEWRLDSLNIPADANDGNPVKVTANLTLHGVPTMADSTT